MRNYLKINKRKIIFTFLFTFNQLILSGYTFNNKKIESITFEKNNFQKQFKSLISNKKKEGSYLIEKEVEVLEKFVDETFNQKNSDQLKELQKIIPNRNTNSVKNAIAPKMSPVIPPNAFLDFNPITEIINAISITPSNIP